MFILCSVLKNVTEDQSIIFLCSETSARSPAKSKARWRNVFSSNINNMEFMVMTRMMTKISGHLGWLCSVTECCKSVFLFFSEFMCMCWYTWRLLFYNQGRKGRGILLDQIPVGERSILDCSFLIWPGSLQTALSLNFVGSDYSQLF